MLGMFQAKRSIFVAGETVNTVNENKKKLYLVLINRESQNSTSYQCRTTKIDPMLVAGGRGQTLVHFLFPGETATFSQ